MKNLIETMAVALVDDEDSVRVEEINGAGTTVIELHVAKSDIGKVIGKQGRTANAMRSILIAHGAKVNKRVVLEIMDGEKAA